MTPVVLVKPGVQFRCIAPAGMRLLAAIQTACERMKLDLTITCGTEAHSGSDPHTHGEAYDVSVAGMSEGQIIALVTGLAQSLGPLFTVLYETPTKPTGALANLAYVNSGATAPHVHLQRKRDTVYPPKGV